MALRNPRVGQFEKKCYKPVGWPRARVAEGVPCCSHTTRSAQISLLSCRETLEPRHILGGQKG